MEAGLALGSNIGDRIERLREARKGILAIGGIAFVAQSPVYETDPVDVPGEFAGLPFLNCALIIETSILVEELIGLFKSVERALGRMPSPIRNAPRPIDIDVIYAGDLTISSGNVEIPHPRWSVRRFVVQPLSDVRPHLRIPGQSGSVGDVLARLDDAGGVVLFADKW